MLLNILDISDKKGRKCPHLKTKLTELWLFNLKGKTASRSMHIFLYAVKTSAGRSALWLLKSVSQHRAVSGHKTRMTSHPLKIAATAGIRRWGGEWFHICHRLKSHSHKNVTHRLAALPGRGEISDQVKVHGLLWVWLKETFNCTGDGLLWK